ncbi:hypothetical protein HH736_004558 [Escherichia coli]|nr:hypothetical protein [Escherichia coli]
MYAQRLAEHGYITVTADAAYQGASGGVPRNVDMTDEQIAKLPFALYRQGYEYYWKTHAHPNIFRSVRDIVPSKRWQL